MPTVVTGLIAELSEFIDDVLPTANFDDEDNDGELKQATTPCPLRPRFPFPHSQQGLAFTFIISSTLSLERRWVMSVLTAYHFLLSLWRAREARYSVPAS